MPKIFWVGLLSFVAAGCASSTMITTNPPGATVKDMSGVMVGRTPYYHTDTNTVGTTQYFTLSKAGYEDAHLNVQRDQWNAARTVMSFLFFWPTLLWATDYRPEYMVELKPQSQNAAPPADSAPPPPPPSAANAPASDIPAS